MQVPASSSPHQQLTAEPWRAPSSCSGWHHSSRSRRTLSLGRRERASLATPFCRPGIARHRPPAVSIRARRYTDRSSTSLLRVTSRPALRKPLMAAARYEAANQAAAQFPRRKRLRVAPAGRSAARALCWLVVPRHRSQWPCLHRRAPLWVRGMSEPAPAREPHRCR
jgi:hypothetical protein